MDPRRRRELKKIDKEQLILGVDTLQRNAVKNVEVDIERVNRIEQILAYNSDPSDFHQIQDEITEMIREFKENFHQHQLELLLLSSKNQVLSSLIKPFGLANVLFQDKIGGNVTTIHNAKQNIYAKESEAYNKEQRKRYTSTKNSLGNKFEGDSKNSVGSQFTKSMMDDKGYVLDAYTQKRVKATDTSPDHAYSLSEYHKNGGFMQSDKKKADFATDHDNLNLTDRSINYSMRDDDKMEWANKKQAGRDQSNSEYYEIDNDALEAAYTKGQETAKKHLPSNIEKTKYYTKNMALTGLNEGAKMGLQQALGLLILEVVNALYDEISDIFKNGFKNGVNNESFFKVLKVRCNRVTSRILDKRKDVVVAFGEGAFSGFISNIITTVINMVYTTSAKVVRAIREGVFSIFKALKMITNPPENLTKEEAYHEATKLLATGAIISIGITMDEVVEKLIISTPVVGQLLLPFASTLADVFVGILTGISSALVVYLIDKIDLFGVNKKSLYDQLESLLDNMCDESMEQIRDNYGHLTTVKI